MTESAPVLVTGAAGFVGYHVANALLDRGEAVLGLDNLNSYYDVRLKEARLARLEQREGFRFTRLDLADRAGMAAFFERERPRRIVHLAAQAGVRYSLENPAAYIDSNLVGFGTILDGAKQSEATHLVYASSSSVYGANEKVPFSEADNVDHPVSLYAATKKSNELMAHVSSHLYGLPTTGLRFFTVYGPWGRPDMAYWSFTRDLFAGAPIRIYNHGQMMRDFTYIDDIVEGVIRVLDQPPAPGAGNHPGTTAPYRLYNIGNNTPVPLEDFITTLERITGRAANRVYLPMQPGDVPATYADIESLQQATGFRPRTSIDDGLRRFVGWYTEYHGIG
jgi:UDP-glucuronate 4-epimerase